MRHVNYEEAIGLMNELYQTTRDVSVFHDRGWGDDKEWEGTIEIITDGNGQKPHASMSMDTFKQLKENKIIGPNNLRTFKARKNHQFQWDEYCKWRDNAK